MKKYVTLLLTIILLAFIGIGIYLYQKIETDKLPREKEQISDVSESTQTNQPEPNKTEIEMPSETEESTESDEMAYGSVRGELCYPSEYIPPLDLYLVNTENNELIKQETETNQMEFEIENIPTGTYIAFAYVAGLEDDYGGGYTNAVPCGLSVECEDHEMLEFKVEENDVTVGIDICDWYGDKIPQRPQ